MLSNDDYKGYFEQIFVLENSMVDLYSQCLKSLDDENLKKVMVTLIADETKHSNILAELKSFF